MTKRPYVKPTVSSRQLAPEEGERFSERRATPRYPFSANALILNPVTSAELAARTSEISLGGCYIEGVDEFQRDWILQIEIFAEGEKFQTRGRVAYVQPSIGMGIEFLELEPEQQRTIAKWVAEISSFLSQQRSD